ncbi:MAG: toll/interleukin-1 receptor domain-containing protein [Desulfobacterales bacterium]|nr:MAG: toll/interleukin-1 receptor domain-containing protein [Desulfobacterales bacterium]
MRVFICWSGRRSKEVAQILEEWLKKTIVGIDPFCSKDIDKGAWWSEEIRQNISTSDAGILCITPENLRSPWLHFEAGALGIGEDKKLFPLLYKTYPGQLESPFSHHQATQLTCEDTLKFCKDIIAFHNDKIRNGNIKRARIMLKEPFRERWSELERKLRNIGPLGVQEMIPEFEQLFQRKTFYEPIDECSAQAWVDRYVGCYETHQLIEEKQRFVRENAWPHVADLYDELIMELDIYAMDIKSLLVPERKYELDRDGRLRMPEGVRETCERKRRRVHDLVLKILTAKRGPVVDNARLYPKFKSLRDRNDQLVYPAEDMIRRSEFESLGLDADNILSLPSSPWDFDRIIFYLIAEQCRSPNIEELPTCVGRELERIRVRGETACPIPLYHAVRALQRTMDKDQSAAGDVELSIHEILKRIEAYLADESDRVDSRSLGEDPARLRPVRSGHWTYDRIIEDMKGILEKIESRRRGEQAEHATK